MSPWISVGLFLLVVVCIPIALKVAQNRYGLGLPAQVHGQPRLVSALSLGAGQRLVVVEVGPDEARERLTELTPELLRVFGQVLASSHQQVDDLSFASGHGHWQ